VMLLSSLSSFFLYALAITIFVSTRQPPSRILPVSRSGYSSCSHSSARSQAICAGLPFRHS
jgi:hypothetical protein